MASTVSSTLSDGASLDYPQVFAVALLVYDHSITIGDEVEYLWKRPKTRSSLWFFATRYMGLFGNVLVTVLGFIDMSIASCNQFNLFKEIFLVITQGVVCILLALRIYALYGCSLRILVSIVGIAMVLAAIALWTFIGQTVVDAPSTAGCDTATGLDYKTSIRIAGAWEALLVYDCIVFGLTIYKTWAARLDHVITGISIPLVTLLLRDGAIYFGVLVLCNLLNILTFYFTGPFWRGNLATFASCMSLTMICRLMLNLHRTADSGINTTHRTLTELDIICPTTGTLDIETSWRDSRVDIF